MSKPRQLIQFIFLILVLFSGCRTAIKSIPEDFPSDRYIHMGQQSAIEGYSNEALLYFTTYIERYPDDITQVIVAEYEIAHIHYKAERFTLAKELFTAILSKYDQEYAELLPAWVRILSEQLLEKINIKLGIDTSDTSQP